MTTSAPNLTPGPADPLPNPNDDSELYNSCLIQGQRSPGPPGQVTVTGFGSPRKLDERDGHGQSGATLAYTGDKLSSGTLWFHLYTTSDWLAWHLFRPLLAKPPVGAKAKALAISYPTLAKLGITSIMVEDEQQEEPDGDTGGWKIGVKVKQFRKPTPALGVPAGAAALPPGTAPAPQDAADARIQQLVAQLAALPGGT